MVAPGIVRGQGGDKDSLIITRTPFRVSFFGGGSDYPTWLEKHDGAVLGAAIDKYCYIHLRYLPPHFEHKAKLVYSKLELVKDYSQVEHPVLRDFLRTVEKGIELYHFSDMPAFRGLGSSSAFVVGLLHAGLAMYGNEVDRKQLIVSVIRYEQDDLKENVGCQDQWLCGLGGVNYLQFPSGTRGHFNPIVEHLDHWPNMNSILRLQEHLMLIDTGTKRIASQIAAQQIAEMPKHEGQMHRMVIMAKEGRCLLEEGNLQGFGELLHEAWMLKKELSPLITFPQAEYVYDVARKYGATGGKVIGAGGGGYFLVFAPPECHKAIEEALPEFKCIHFGFDYEGTKVIYKDNG